MRGRCGDRCARGGVRDGMPRAASAGAALFMMQSSFSRAASSWMTTSPTACDTGLFYDMKLIGEEGIDLAILPIGDNYTMGPDDAVRAVKFLAPRKVLPIHYNTFDVIKQDAHAWADRVRKETSAEPVVLKPGESVEV